jgi:hypothetical protein
MGILPHNYNNYNTCRHRKQEKYRRKTLKKVALHDVERLASSLF